MIHIKRLKRANKRSGHLLAVGETTMVKGLAITNVKAGAGVYVDRVAGKRKKKRSAK